MPLNEADTRAQLIGPNWPLAGPAARSPASTFTDATTAIPLAELERLSGAVLARAFRGEL